MVSSSLSLLIRGTNLFETKILSDLKLPTIWVDQQLGGTTSITWSSSDEATINPYTGKVTRPSTGAKLVQLTATLSDGNSKVFELLVPSAHTDSGNVLVVTKDLSPATGVGVPTNVPLFTLDEKNSSVIIDLKSNKKVNVVKLLDSDESARLNREVLTLWVSKDNVTYTQVEDFKLLHVGESWYLYDFEATGRYIKVHCTHFDTYEADFVSSPATMITAYYEDVFGGNGGTFTGSQQITFTNTDSVTSYDHAWSISKDKLKLTGKDSAIRVYLDGKLLYHYTTENSLVVRIPEVKAGAAVTLTVLCGNDSAMDISNKESVYEITYGTREAWDARGTVRWLYGPLEDGSIISIVDGGQDKGLSLNFSYDGGRTWTARTVIPATQGKFTAMGGFGYDEHTKELYIFGYLDEAYSDVGAQDIHIIKSKDQAQTWEYVGKVANRQDASYLTYTDFITLSTYDGDGPNVDFVFPISQMLQNTTFGFRAAYSTDCGKTWQVSNLIYNSEAVTHEDGASEGTIMEREDGTLVLLIRNQMAGNNNFSQAYSYNHGATWTEFKTSSVYTVNTQPMMFRYRNDIMLSWGGNNMYGGLSRLRTPHSVAITYDGMETFENIQDLYVKYSLQGMTLGSMNRITNQKIVITDDDTFLSCWMNLTRNQSEETNMLLRVENFHDFFYRTKNAYDSFEGGSVKYEGWSITTGNAVISDAYATDGSHSMQLIDNAVVTRSIPYFQDGTISMDIYVDGSANFNIDFQSAYTNLARKGAPLGIQVANNAITFYGADAASGLTLKSGWNTLVFELDLDERDPSATLSVNGSEAKAMPINTKIGDYVCFITPITSTTIYIDNLLVESDLDALNVYEEKKDDVQVTEITLDKATASVKAGETLTLNAIYAPENATYQYASWSSSDETVATVDKNGVVTALRSGIVTITATSGYGTATCKITVVHNLVLTPEKPAAPGEDGCKEHYSCKVCGRNFWDAEGKQTVLKADELIIPKLPAEDTVNWTVIVIAAAAAVLLVCGGGVTWVWIRSKRRRK